MADQAHWEHVYRTKQPTEVSWYRPHLELSLELIAHAGGTDIIDVGAGESTLVDDLLLRPEVHPTALDLSATALDATRRRLGAARDRVQWIEGDVTTVELPRAAYDVWHDRAVFHFLTDWAARVRYVEQVARSVRPGGHVIVGTFGPRGPEKCSGLTIARYDATGLHGQFGHRFRLLQHREEMHATPAGREQQFVWCMCRLDAT